jgi:hypothetical protein
MVSVLSIVRKVGGFKPRRGRRIFKGSRHPQDTFLRTGSLKILRHVKHPFEV